MRKCTYHDKVRKLLLQQIRMASLIPNISTDTPNTFRDKLLRVQQRFNAPDEYIHEKLIERKRQMREDQRFNEERLKILGPELAAAQFIVGWGGAVKVAGKENWFSKVGQEVSFLPNRKVEDFFLEGINLQKMPFLYEGLENLVDLKYLVYFSAKDNELFDDFCLSQLAASELKETVQFLDFSGCKRITSRGLATLHHFKDLKALKISDLSTGEDFNQMLSDMLPGCAVLGTGTLSSETELDDLKLSQNTEDSSTDSDLEKHKTEKSDIQDNSNKLDETVNDSTSFDSQKMRQRVET